MTWPTTDHDFFAQAINDSQDARWVAQISAELLSAFKKLAHVKNGVSVFGSARPKPDSEVYRLGVEVAEKLGRAGYQIITGGGPGLMEAANLGAKNVGAESIGLGMELRNEEGFNDYVTTEVNFEHFFVRKVSFVKYSRAFVVLPGGFGTMDELFEALTLRQTEKIENFPIILIGTQFWKPMLHWIEGQLLAQGFINPVDVQSLVVTDDLDEMIERLGADVSSRPSAEQ